MILVNLIAEAKAVLGKNNTTLFLGKEVRV